MPTTPAPHSAHVYVESDVPGDMTLLDWRRSRQSGRVTSPVGRLLRRARLARRARRQLVDI